MLSAIQPYCILQGHINPYVTHKTSLPPDVNFAILESVNLPYVQDGVIGSGHKSTYGSI
ncbi:hypothetical protein J31TS3_19200 [Paenibacillus lactis]|nr:hypothetical protein J31TS3_19200 [Paenibacillus lactis]